MMLYSSRSIPQTLNDIAMVISFTQYLMQAIVVTFPQSNLIMFLYLDI